MEEENNIWQISIFLERLKICWYVLTLKNFVYFGTGKNPIKWNEDGTFNGLNHNKIKSYSHVSDKSEFYTNKGKSNLGKYIWMSIKEVAEEEVAKSEQNAE